MFAEERGFTLTEFMVAILILVVGLLGMMKSIELALNHNMTNLMRSEAVRLADDRMMLKRAKAFAAISTATDPPKFVVARNVRGVFKNYSVQEVVNPSTNLSKEIIINVSWTRKKATYSHSMSSVVSTFPQ